MRPRSESPDIVQVGIWIRVSTEDQARGESPDHHERRARAYAEAKGWKVLELYDLSGVSGKSVMDNPEAKRMMKHVKEGRIKALIFSKLARLARNTRELLDFADFFRDHDANLVSLSESIDTSTPAGRLFFTIVAAMAQWEREEIAERVAVSVPIRAKLGKNTGGAASFGYQWVDGKLVPDQKEAPIRAKIYDLFREHGRKKTVARILNEQGYRTRNGSKFTDTTITRLIEDPTAKGVRRANYTKNTGQRKAWALKPEKDWIFHEVPSIVPEALWDECNAILMAQASKSKRPAKKPVQLFGGHTFCHCGGKMYVKSNSPKYVCLKCRNKIPIVDLEAVFAEQLKDFIFSDEEMAAYLEQADSTAKAKEEQIATLEKERYAVSAEMEKLYQLYLKDGIAADAFRERNGPLEARLKQIDASLPKLEAELDIFRINVRSQDVIKSEARDLYGRWPTMKFEQKRYIVETIVDRITVGKADVEIELHFLPEIRSLHSRNSGKKAMHDQPRVAFLPPGRKSLKTLKPVHYEREPKTLGQHLKKRRLELGLRQRDVQERFKLDHETLATWEKDRCQPSMRHWPGIINFLGFDPTPEPKTVGEHLRAYRRRHGISRKALAAELEVDEATLWRWEEGRRMPNTAWHVAAVKKLLVSSFN
jgi:site-specific DNA recombinase